MTSYESIVSKKYAQAFLNIIGDRLSLEYFTKLSAAQQFFAHHHKQLFFLTMPIVDDDTKVAYLEKVFTRFGLDDYLKKLAALLVRHKRAFLMPRVLKQLCRLYKKRNNIAQFSISSSHALGQDELKTVQQFLVRKTGQTILYEYMIDKRLIAGIRLQSDTLLWDYSIRKQLEQIKLPLIR